MESLEVQIADEEKLAVLLSGKYEAVVTMLELASEAGRLTYSLAADKLKDFAGRNNNDAANNIGILAVRKPYTMKYFRCGKDGHVKKFCPNGIQLVSKKQTNAW